MQRTGHTRPYSLPHSDFSPEGSMCCSALMVDTYWCRMSVVAAPAGNRAGKAAKWHDIASLHSWEQGATARGALPHTPRAG